MNKANDGQVTSRREFLKLSITVGGSIVVGVGYYGTAHATPEDSAFSPNAYVRIAPDNSVTVICGKSEMGQGVHTAYAQIVAEELDADWSTIVVEQAPVHLDHANPGTPLMATGGSTSVRMNWDRLRRAGAGARFVLLEAAARSWRVDKSQLHARAGWIHGPDGRKARFADFLKACAGIELPQAPPLKSPSEYTVIGRPLLRVDTPPKVTGQAQFGIDVQLPGMLLAVMAFPPAFGATVIEFDPKPALAIAGVRGVFQVTGGIAVVADTTWAAMKGREALSVRWSKSPFADLSMDALRQQYRAALDHPGLVDKESGMSTVKTKSSLTMDFEQPYLVQAPMEPMNCTVEIRADGADVWTGTQGQSLAQRYAAGVTGLKPEQIRVHTTFLGGSFGRRGVNDFVRHAAEIAKAAGKPVKMLYTRADDMRAGYYRPFNRIRISATLGHDGRIASFTAKTAVAAISKWTGFSALKKPNGVDHYATETLAPFYDIEHVEVRWVETDPGIPIWFWRTPGGSQNCFAVESMVDELALLAGRDPYTFRRSMLTSRPRHIAVLDLAAKHAGWNRPAPSGSARGIAIVEIFGSIVAEVAEVKIVDGSVRVVRVTCAIDCGTAINPQQIRAQAESSIVFGLGALLYGDVTIEGGAVQQSNFHDYQVLRMQEMPAIDVHIVPSEAPPGGMGEPALPPVLPAVTNALRVLTGKRINQLPVRLTSDG
ncbi:xanthine dehydrogenase family protein molybdopterin-binding subunit [Pseudoduganella umbonata]|uniref:Isoquinoline 1-oxidoreductase beta subunit n=1 Tax=Pseudoduganella umbonata TaxID=864828 RepID=A0A4P8HZB9_9BURK|nr:xanthine dehydrogenase family protein molybdopterin-binding subunit [Pseudoduganella umbonata]MBB3224093.1 isoquinoline 1-oxidoreductase beta subunit [Pseudoduganella umbonata]QCP14040.1 xanthine dehydrogenase family protein molybdopterin-binding subunit [Pseudoduganella umbonata]